MSGAKRVILCLLTALAVNAAVASAASASPAWWVMGKALATGATDLLAEATEVVEPFVVKEVATGEAVECKSVKIDEGFIEGESKAAVKALLVGECSYLTKPSCKVLPITTKPLSITLEGEPKALKLNFKPTTGTEVATVEFSGAGCPSMVVLKGTMACNYPGVETEAVSHLLEFTANSGTTLLSNFGSGFKKAELKGLDRFWLASEKDWSAR
jgi:hypothetical protein